MTDLMTALANMECEEPSWLHEVANVESASPHVAAAFLNDLDEEDFGIFVLAYGMGMRLGVVSQILKLDPALVVWRMRRAINRAESQSTGLSAAGLELAVTELLRESSNLPETVPPPHHGDTWSAKGLVQNLDQQVQARLHARWTDDRPTSDASRSGVGVGLLVVILMLVAGFMVFGALRDVNPLWRGKDLMLRGHFGSARIAFESYWDPITSHSQVSLCWLAVGEFDKALEEMAFPGVLEQFGAFAPTDEVIPRLESEPGGRALLPRGLVRNRRPTFVFKTGPKGWLQVKAGWREDSLALTEQLPDTRGNGDVAFLPYPEAWPDLPREVVIWSISDPETTQADFTVISGQRLHEMRSVFKRFLTRSIPSKAQWFFRGHYYMRKGLHSLAGDQFAKLVSLFPGQEYPRQMLDEIADILGIDASAFLR